MTKTGYPRTKDGQFTKVKNRAIQRKRIRQAVRRHLTLREETESI